MELEHDGEVIVLAVPDAVLGRTSACEIQVSHPLVSRRHCRLEATAEGVWLEDLGSSNGTYLNGERVAERRSVRPGDAFQIGNEGPRFALLLAVVDGRDVAGTLSDEDQATMMAGDPRLAGLRAQVSVSPDATAPAAAAAESETRESSPPVPDPQTTGSIPVAVPIGTGGDSLLGQTDMLPPPQVEAPTQEADQPARDGRTRTVEAPSPEAPARDASGPRAAAAGTQTATATHAPAARPQAVASAETAEPAAAAPPKRGAGRGVVIGFLIGLAVLLALGVLTPLGGALHGLAPWSAAPAGDAR